MNVVSSMKTFAKVSEKFIKQNLPTIAMGVGVGLMVGGTATAIIATTKSVPIVQKLQSDGEATKKKICAECWKLYAPSFIMTAVGATCIVSANRMNLKRIAAVSAVASLNEQKLRDYKDAVKKTISKDKVSKIEHEAAEKQVYSAGPATGRYPGKGPQLCQDCQTNQRVWSSRNDIERAVNEINSRCIDGDRQTLNDFFVEIGLPECNIGRTMGWEPDSDGRYNPSNFSVSFDYVVDEITGEPILLFTYDVQEFLPF